MPVSQCQPDKPAFQVPQVQAALAGKPGQLAQVELRGAPGWQAEMACGSCGTPIERRLRARPSAAQLTEEELDGYRPPARQHVECLAQLRVARETAPDQSPRHRQPSRWRASASAPSARTRSARREPAGRLQARNASPGECCASPRQRACQKPYSPAASNCQAPGRTVEAAPNCRICQPRPSPGYAATCAHSRQGRTRACLPQSQKAAALVYDILRYRQLPM